MYHIFFIQSLIKGYLGFWFFFFFHLFTTVNNAALSMGYIHKEMRSIGEDVGKKATLIYYWCECISVQSLRKAVWKFLKILKRQLPGTLLLGLFMFFHSLLKSIYRHT